MDRRADFDLATIWRYTRDRPSPTTFFNYVAPSRWRTSFPTLAGISTNGVAPRKARIPLRDREVIESHRGTFRSLLLGNSALGQADDWFRFPAHFTERPPRIAKCDTPCFSKFRFKPCWFLRFNFFIAGHPWETSLGNRRLKTRIRRRESLSCASHAEISLAWCFAREFGTTVQGLSR